MSERNWTAGPWIVSTYDGLIVSIANGTKEEQEIAVCDPNAPSGYDLDGLEEIANAHLIAAAPDLYEALEAARELGVDDTQERIINAALAKARGEQT